MKNAMKKLTSLLLVAVLLVGVMPFGASAAEDEISFAAGDDVAAASVDPVVVETPAPAPAAQEDEVSFSTSDNAVKAQPTTPVSVLVVVDYSDKADVNKDITVNEGTSAYDVLCEVVDAAEIENIQANYAVSYSADAVAAGMRKLTVTCTRKVVETPEYYVEIDVKDSEQGNKLVRKHGDVLTLNEALLTDNDMSVPAGQKIAKFFVNDKEMKVGDTYTVVGGTKIEVVTIPDDGTSTENGGSTNNGSTNNGSTNNGTTNNGTASGVSVIFYDYDGKTVIHTATTNANGKLNAIDVNYASKLVSAPSGYTFSDRWKKNNTGDSIATSTIISELTFTEKTSFTPVFTANKSDVVSSTKNQNDIFLNIFVNKDFNNCKTIKLNDHWTIADDKITTYEILNYVVTDYYKATDSNKGLQCDGMYYSVGSFMYNWLLDNDAVKTNAIDNISVKRSEGTVTINVMVTNASLKTASTAAADSSNPKTGDSIFTAMTVMGISAASLAAVMYFYNKKRMAL